MAKYDVHFRVIIPEDCVSASREQSKQAILHRELEQTVWLSDGFIEKNDEGNYERGTYVTVHADGSKQATKKAQALLEEDQRSIMDHRIQEGVRIEHGETLILDSEEPATVARQPEDEK